MGKWSTRPGERAHLNENFAEMQNPDCSLVSTLPTLSQCLDGTSQYAMVISFHTLHTSSFTVITSFGTIQCELLKVPVYHN